MQINHVILTIPNDGATIWLENTSNALPFNYLGTFTQDRYALMENGDSSKLIKTPKLEMSNVLEKRNYTFSYSSNNILNVTISKTLKGKSFESYRYAKFKVQNTKHIIIEVNSMMIQLQSKHILRRTLAKLIR